MTALEVRNLSLAYGVNRAVRDVSFSIEERETYAILGANGAGKTSILRAASGLLPIAAGDIRLHGQSLIRQGAHAIVLKGLSHVPEGRKIFPEMTVLENLLIGATVHIRDKRLTRELLERNFELFPMLRDRAAQLGGTLSGGQQQQLTIARGLMANPKVLIVDEPTLGLAPAIIQTLADTMRKLMGLGLTIVIAEQNADFALNVATRGVVMSSGQVSFQGDVATLRKTGELRKAYLGA
jgi:branched-chain amino acid transport system ATP-binding protein